MSNTDKQPVITEVVVEMEGRGLLSGRVEDFILSPSRGSEYFYEGRLYEVAQAIETIGDACSPKGSMLMELLAVLYPDPSVASALFGGMKRIPSVMGSGDVIVGPGASLILTATKERLLYLRLKLVHTGSGKSLWANLLEQASASAASNKE